MLGLALIGVLISPERSLAHPLIDQARASYEKAHFEQALEELSEASGLDDLTREDALALLTTSALVHFAIGNPDAMRADLSLLAAIEPMHELGDESPPSLRRAFDEARRNVEQPLGVELDLQRQAGRVTARGHAVGHGADRVRRVTVRCREGGGSWTEGVGEVGLEADPSSSVECGGAAIGIGGATVVTSRDVLEVVHSEATQNVVVPNPREVAAQGGDDTEPGPIMEDDDEGAPAWPWILRVASAGDVNNDGLNDVLIATNGMDGELGSFLLWLGASEAPLIISHPAGSAEQSFGDALVGGGDFNGDGRSDVVVGAPDTNEVFLFRGVGVAGLTHIGTIPVQPVAAPPGFGAVVTIGGL